MKIILTTHVFLPDFFGGTETLVHSVALSLKRRGHSVIVVTGFPVKDSAETIDHFDEYQVDSIPVLRFKHTRASDAGTGKVMRDDYDNPVFEARFCQLLDEFVPDVVHFHHLERLSIRAIDACHSRGIPAFLTATDFWYICPSHALLLPDGKICDGPRLGGANCLQHLAAVSQPGWVAGIVNHGLPSSVLGIGLAALKASTTDFSGRIGNAQALARRGDTIADRLALLQKIFVPTRHAQTMLENNGIKGVKFKILPFGIKDHGYTKRIRQKSEAQLVLAFIGSLLPHKGLHVLLNAVKLMPADSPVQLRVYGSAITENSEYLASLRKCVQGDARVRFCGTFENARLPAILHEIDALVIPSLWHENMPLISLSAQAAGCPLIASDIGGLSGIVTHRVNGLLFKPGSASELTERIGEILSDRELLHKLSSAAVAPVYIDRYVDELELEYRQTCGELS